MNADEVHRIVHSMILEIFELEEGELPPDPDTNLALFGDSLQMLELMSAVENRFDFEMPPASFSNSKISERALIEMVLSYGQQ